MIAQAPRLTTTSRSWKVAFPYLLILPTLLLVTLFTLYPAVATVRDSMTQPGRRASDPVAFVGFDNYVDLFDTSHYLGARFGKVLTNTLTFALNTVFISLPIALGMALLLNQRLHLVGLWRFSVFYPSLLPLLGAASIWAFLYSDSIGLFNTVLRSVGLAGVNWLGNPDVILFSQIVFTIWVKSGYMMLFYLAGLQNIPRDIYEASDLDGASAWQRLRFITLPLLSRTTLFLLVTSVPLAFMAAEHLPAMNNGNPADRGNLMLYFIFQNIGERRNWGYVNAMTVMLILLLLGFTLVNFLIFERRRRDEA